MHSIRVGLEQFALDLMHRRTPRRTTVRTLVVPASTFGSLGDLAMIEGLHVLLSEQGTEQISLARYGKSDIWRTSFPFYDAMIVPEGLRGWFRWIEGLSGVDRLFLNGADVLDGKYSLARSLKRLSVVNYAARREIPCTITGFSFNSTAPQAIVDAFNRIPASVRFCLRDPGSLERFNERTRHQGVQVADLAFLVPAKDVSQDPNVRRLQAYTADGRHVVALTPNVHCVSTGSSLSEKRRMCVDYFARVAQGLASRGCVVVLLPHDTRGANSDDALCQQLASELATTGVEHVVIPPPSDPAYVKGIVGYCDLVITGRMHCGIAALGAGTPVILIDYQDKVKGLEQFFEMGLSVKVTDDAQAAAGETLLFVDQILANLQSRRDAVRRGAARAVALARGNLPE